MNRITMLSITRQTQSVIHTRFGDLAKLQQQMATGRLLNRPSDGPAEVSNAIRLRNQLVELGQNESNIWDGLGWMELTDTTMMSMNVILQRALELSAQGDTDALSVDQRKYIAAELSQLTRQMADIMNQRYKGNYIFSGTHTDKPAVVMVESDASEAINRGNRMFSFNADMSNLVWDISTNRFNSVQIFDPAGLPHFGGFSLPTTAPAGGGVQTVSNIIPGSVEITMGGVLMREGIDFRIDHLSGTIELLPARGLNGNLLDSEGRLIDSNGDFIDGQGNWVEEDGTVIGPIGDPLGLGFTPVNTTDPTNTTPGIWPALSAPALAQDFSSAPPGNYPGGLQIRMARLTESTDFYGDPISTSGRIFRQVEEGVTVGINVSTHDLRVNSNVDVFTALIKLGQGLINASSAEINQARIWLDQAKHNILSAQSTNGSVINRLTATLERNEIQQVEVDRLREKVEDADYATTITQFSIQQAVFNAALQSTARIMQMSLMDFIR